MLSVPYSERFLLPLLLAAILTAFSATGARADGGWYLGASAGQASLEIDVEGSDSNIFRFDESDTAWKVFGGYVLDLPLIDLGVEAGYVDLASSVAQFPGFQAALDPSGINAWGIAGVDIGPFGLFGKLGAIAWNIDGQTSGSDNRSLDQSGTDIGYGLGAKFMLWSLEVRVEYERYDIEEAKDVAMASIGLSWVF
jgi:outer membrane immunogenic protein